METLYLYHGSKVLVDELVPNQAYGFGGKNDCINGIYAVARKELAIPFCFKLINLSKDSVFSVNTNENLPTVTLKNCEVDWEHKGYLYKLESNNFITVDKLQWVAKVPVKPVEIIVIDPKIYRVWIKE